MKRMLCCLLLLLLAVTGTAAGEASYEALKEQYDGILQREEAIALEANDRQQDALKELHVTCMHLAGQTASAKGFVADVTVYVLLDENHTIVDLLVDAPWETPGFGTRCEEEAFTRQFIGQTGPFILGNGVDAVSGATVTSRAVVQAINSLLPCQEQEIITVSAKGLLSDVQVTVTRMSDTGVITSLLVDCSGETQAIAAPCAESAYLSQFIGQTGPFTPGVNVDTISGATHTSMAVINAINTLFEEGAEAE